MTIKLILSYDIIYKNEDLVDHLWLDPYALNEWIFLSSDTCEIDISSDDLWILDWLMDYLD